MSWAVRALSGARARDTGVLVAASRFLRSACARRVLLGTVVFSLCEACGGSGETEETRATRSVCSDCPGLAGGESSDFGGGSASTWRSSRR